jgi:exopolyphosphatase / guanosine-5'-triphosphate,3'-diphosphate pyrophosphatase
MRVAAVDLGTNSTRLLVADVAGSRVEELHRQTTITRLGEGVDARGRLLPLPVARVRNCLSDYRRTAESLEATRTLAVATSAVRDAENGEAFLGEIEWSYGFATRLLSGEDEALLTFRGATTGRELDEGTLLVDVGGGSTELVIGGPAGVEFHASLPLGSVRHTERYLLGDPPTDAELAECQDAVTAEIAAHAPAERVRTAIGTAGTITSLAALDLGLEAYDPKRVHGHVVTATAVEAQLARLSTLTNEARRGLPSLEPERAPVIVAGAVIVAAILDFFGLEALEASERDLLDGAALEAAELPEPDEGAAPPGAFTCC